MTATDLERTAARIHDDRAAIHHHLPCAMGALALVGLAVATYDSIMVSSGLPLWCPPPIDGCNVVATSPYARMLGLPIAYYGVGFYLGILGIAVLLAIRPSSRMLRLAAVLCTGAGVLFSLYFMVLQIGFIHAFCIYCLVSGVTTLLLAIAALADARATRLWAGG
ncbi:MAG TPA: vitamin K epoxide reductase family protein [Xanthobacteraceae bacterium]|nr:vitamin K epoxide reductase family protein [Xanthobacteraceae bacterium]